MFTKKQFYDMIKTDAKGWASLHRFIDFGNYTLWFGINGRHEKSVIVTCQLINRYAESTYKDKYICPDLNIDCLKEKIHSDYQLFKYLEKHYTKAITDYETKFPQWRQKT